MIALVIDDRCTKCGNCVQVCPTNVFDTEPDGRLHCAPERVPDVLHVRSFTAPPTHFMSRPTAIIRWRSSRRDPRIGLARAIPARFRLG